MRIYGNYDNYYEDATVTYLGRQTPVYKKIIERFMPDEEIDPWSQNRMLLCGMHPKNGTYGDFVDLVENTERLYGKPFHAVIADRNAKPFTNIQDTTSPYVFYEQKTQGGSIINAVQCDLRTPSFGENIFSIIIADYTIGCMPKSQLREFALQIKSLLSNDGIAIITYDPRIFPWLPTFGPFSTNDRNEVYEQFTKPDYKTGPALQLTLYAEANDKHDELMVFTHQRSQHNVYQFGIKTLSCLSCE